MPLTYCSLWHIFAFSLDCLPFPSNPVHLDRFTLANLAHTYICVAGIVNIAKIQSTLMPCRRPCSPPRRPRRRCTLPR
ncbi:hypothetical protein K438DRAFT_1852829, partial [Mycena galopus ATCC 62051]